MGAVILVICVIIIFALSGVLTTMLYRVKEDYPYNLFKPFSNCVCDHCDSKISSWYTTPIIGFIILCGKTKCCNKRLPVRYLVMEILVFVASCVALVLLRNNALVCYFALCLISFALFMIFAFVLYRGKFKIFNFILSFFSILAMYLPVLLSLMLLAAL